MAGLYCRRTCEVELESANRSHHSAIKDEEWIGVDGHFCSLFDVGIMPQAINGG